MKRLALILLVSLTAAGHGQTKTKIYVDCTCEDGVGSQYATALRDAITRSPRYMLAPASSEGSGKDTQYNFTLSIVSLDENPAMKGTSSSISVVLLYAGFMVSQHVQTCGYNAIDRCVAGVIAFTDGDIQRWNKL